MTRRIRLDREIERELGFHINERIDDLVASGMSLDEARRAAQRRFGNFGLQRERTRDMNLPGLVESVEQDIRYGIRMIARNRVFSIIVVLSLALGIAANTTLFSFIDAMLLRPLALPDASGLVYFEWRAHSNWLSMGTRGTTNYDETTKMRTSTSLSYDLFKRFRTQSATLAEVFAFSPLYQVTVSSEGQPDLIPGQLVSGNYFSGLRAGAAIGRVLTEKDDMEGTPAAVISYRYWQRRFDGRSDVLGKAIVLNGLPLTIVGVTQPGFLGTSGFGSPTDISIPFGVEPQIPQFRAGSGLAQPAIWWVRIMGRLKPGFTYSQVRAELEPVFWAAALDGWNAAPPDRREDPGPQREMPQLAVLSGARGLTDNFDRPFLLIAPLAAISLILLLIVCVNVANLMLARCAARQSELQVRLALGGSRLRLVRQLLTETVLLALASGGLGAVFAYWGKNLLVGWLPNTDSAFYDLRIDLPVLLFSIGLAIVAGILMGIGPALRATRDQIHASLKESARTLVGPRTRLSRSLLVAQVALSMILLVGAGMFIQTIRNLRNVEVGFRTSNLLLFKANPRPLKYTDPQIAGFYDEVLNKTAALPGVLASTLSTYPLVGSSGSSDSLLLRSRPSEKPQGVWILHIHSNFFSSLGVPLLAGRDFSANDLQGRPKVALVNETLVRQMFGSENPIGSRVAFPGTNEDIEIVGVVKDVRIRPSREAFSPAIFLPDTQGVPGSVTFALRTAIDPASLVGQVRETVRQIDSNVPLFDIETQEEQVESGFMIERLFASATAAFGAIALVLACIGLFGLMSYSVERRTNEIGVRMALGARGLDVVQLVMRQTFMLVLTGIFVGFGGSYAAGRALVSMPFLFHVAPNDPVAVIVAISTMIVVACVAAYLPARRASRVDPSIALRCE
jgi:predicted permease